MIITLVEGESATMNYKLRLQNLIVHLVESGFTTIISKLTAAVFSFLFSQNIYSMTLSSHFCGNALHAEKVWLS